MRGALRNIKDKTMGASVLVGRADISIGNDHGGFGLKLQIVDHLRQRGLVVEDVGSSTPDIVRYPILAAKVAEAVQSGRAGRGILICSTGIGMSILANRYEGIRASLCTSVYMGQMTRAHNNSNVLCLGGKITTTIDALAILDAWLDTPFEGGRHNISLGLVAEAEASIGKCGVWSDLNRYQPDGEKIRHSGTPGGDVSESDESGAF